MTHGVRPLLLAALSLSLALGPSPAKADGGDKEACARAYESAQRLRKKGFLRASRRELLECARASCPTVLSTDCAGWLREIEGALPTIVPVVRDADGRDIADARVFIDGDLVASRLEGRALELDPGQHQIRIVVDALPPVEQTIVVREGERHRAVAVSFPRVRPAVTGTGTGTGPGAAPGGDAPTSGAASAEIPATAPSTGRPFAWVLGGVGVASLGGFAYFGVTGLNQESRLRECRPKCAESAVADARRSYLVADVTLGVGVAALLASTYFFLKKPGTASTTGAAASAQAASVWVAPTVLAGGGVHASIGGKFAP